MNRRVLVDAGPLVAIRNRRDQHHARVLELAKSVTESLFTCWPVVAEACYLLGGKKRRQMLPATAPEQVLALLKLIADGGLILFDLGQSDMPAVSAIIAKYYPLDFADACVMHLAEREGIDEVFTVDAPDYLRYRKKSGQSLTVIA